MSKNNCLSVQGNTHIPNPAFDYKTLCYQQWMGSKMLQVKSNGVFEYGTPPQDGRLFSLCNGSFDDSFMPFN